MIEEWKSWPMFNIWLIDQDRQRTLATCGPFKNKECAEQCAKRICAIKDLKYIFRKPFRYLVEEVK